LAACVAAIVACAVYVASPAAAHDPGLSFTTVSVSSDGVLAAMRFHDADLAPLRAAGDNALGTSLTVRAGGADLEPVRSSIGSKDGHTTLELAFELPVASSFDVSVPLLASLPRGHKQHVEIRDASGALLVSSILSARADSVHVPLRGVAAVSPGRSATLAATARNTVAAEPAAHQSASWFALGIGHILEGYDHLLFVFALLLGAASVRASVRLITAFTVGHSLSLALAATGMVRVPGAIVEPVIAASIVVVALLALADLRARRNGTEQQTPRREVAAVTFGFGLVHGLGFASVLAEAGIGAESPARLASSLLAFNLGVEAGQLAFAIPVLAMLAALRHLPAFRRHGLALCSTGVAACGAFWFVQRVTGG